MRNQSSFILTPPSLSFSFCHYHVDIRISRQLHSEILSFSEAYFSYSYFHKPYTYFVPTILHWKRPWCWEGLEAGGEGDDRGWDGWMASPTRWTWVWVDSGSWWWTGRPVMLWFMGSQRVGHDWATELNWTDTLLRSRIMFKNVFNSNGVL